MNNEQMYKRVCLLFRIISFFILPSILQSIELSENRPPSPPTEVKVFDTPNDKGGSITITWKKSADDGAGENDVIGYDILRSQSIDTGYVKIASVIPGDEQFVDETAKTGVTYYYKIRVSDGEFTSDSEPSPPVVAIAQWFHRGRTNMLILLVVFSGLVLWFISRARRGEELYIRSVAGLEAVDEAVGRATEMGKPVLFIPGILDMDNIQTIAGLSILGRVASKTAEYGAPLMVPTRSPLVMTAARETVKEAHLSAGRPDTYDEEKIWYLTSEQFGYAAGVDGIMVREKPGAIFYMGAFYAESLVLAETGHSTGAIQIAGTAMPAQLPFFVTACDYTLIGEELFAASAYLSKEPTLLGSLKGQDWGKAIFIGLIVLGVILTSFGITWLVRLLTVG
ncbi:MAG TPA: fibronectin type III domain-containing protein [bacterium (Candidatus Stahlbacteria)]|nr:fibronectin type III domain-containing protein [Candidatus Stahlbacteria bacterium]